MLVRYNRLKIIIGAGEAKPGGTIGATLSPYLFSANMTEFCKKFNEMTQIYEVGFPLFVEIFCDVVEKTYSFFVKKPSLIFFIRKMKMDFQLKGIFSWVSLYDLIIFFNKNFYINQYSASLFLLRILKHKDIVNNTTSFLELMRLPTGRFKSV
jgi:hypothetical protein